MRDAETPLVAIDACGIEEAFAQSGGMFAIAVWDWWKRPLFVARDRFGQKPHAGLNAARLASIQRALNPANCSRDISPAPWTNAVCGRLVT